MSLLNRLLADLAIQSISSKSYVNPHIVGKAKKQFKKENNTYFGEDLFIIGEGGYLLIGGRDYTGKNATHGSLLGFQKKVDPQTLVAVDPLQQVETTQKISTKKLKSKDPLPKSI